MQGHNGVDITDARKRIKSAEQGLWEPLANEIEMSWNMMAEKRLPARRMQVVEVDRLTERGAKVGLRPIYRGATSCHRCGRTITHPTSSVVGYGPDCCEIVGIERPGRGVSAAALLVMAENAERRAEVRIVWMPRRMLEDQGVDLKKIAAETSDSRIEAKRKVMTPEGYPENVNTVGAPTFYVEISRDKQIAKRDPSKAVRCLFVRCNSPRVDTDAFPHMAFGSTPKEAASAFAKNLKYAGLTGHVKKASR